MATVFWRGKQWIAQWYRPDTTRVKRATGESGKRAAERAAAEMEAQDRASFGKDGRALQEILSRASAEAKAGKLSLARAEEHLLELRRTIDPDFRVMSLTEYLADWLRSKEPRVGMQTMKVYQSAVRHFTGALGSKIMSAPVADLTSQQVERAVVKLKDSKLRASTINLSLRSFRQALRQAVQDDVATKNVAEPVPVLPEVDTVEKAPFTPEEVRGLIAACPDKEWARFILLAVQSGLRLSDLMRLDRSHIEGGRIVIRPKKTERQGKVISIPLSAAGIESIGTRKGPLFPVLGKKLPGTVAARFRKVMKDAAVPYAVPLPGGELGRRSFHSLRHTFTSWLADADIAADVRQKLTGHSSAKAHARYTHHDTALDRAIQSLPDIS